MGISRQEKKLIAHDAGASGAKFIWNSAGSTFYLSLFFDFDLCGTLYKIQSFDLL
jgi:hypothetical protein